MRSYWVLLEYVLPDLVQNQFWFLSMDAVVCTLDNKQLSTWHICCDEL